MFERLWEAPRYLRANLIAPVATLDDLQIAAAAGGLQTKVNDLSMRTRSKCRRWVRLKRGCPDHC